VPAGASKPPKPGAPHAVIEPSQGRYVRIQLLDKNYLSLAEVQVMGIDPLRFAKVDYSSTHNDLIDVFLAAQINLPPSAVFIFGIGGALI
jgi:hypothetical protein